MLASYSFSVASGADQEASDPTLRFCYGDRSRQPRLPCSADPAPPIASASIFRPAHPYNTPRRQKVSPARTNVAKIFAVEVSIDAQGFQERSVGGYVPVPPEGHACKDLRPSETRLLSSRSRPSRRRTRQACTSRRGGSRPQWPSPRRRRRRGAPHSDLSRSNAGRRGSPAYRRSWRPGGRRGRPASGCRSACRRA